jgi:hypothetical protein
MGLLELFGEGSNAVDEYLTATTVDEDRANNSIEPFEPLYVGVTCLRILVTFP